MSINIMLCQPYLSHWPITTIAAVNCKVNKIISSIKKEAIIKQKRYYAPVIYILPGAQVHADIGESRDVIITANKFFFKWGEFFADETATTAIIDGIIHHCHIFPISGESYRLKIQLDKQNSRGNL